MSISKFTKICILIAAILPFSLDAGDIVGTVKYKGTPPKVKKIRMDADPVCSAAHQEAAYSETFIVDSDGNLANVIVFLKGVKYSGDIPSTPETFDQKGCIYTPHVMGIMAGQELLILNSDPTLHNIHALPEENDEFNTAMPKFRKKMTHIFEEPEAAFPIKCDVHPWMKGYIQVFDHPYFAVTGPDGTFKIKNVPAGTYEIIAWQERFKTKNNLIQKVTVGAEESSVNFTFERPKRKKK